MDLFRKHITGWRGSLVLGGVGGLELGGVAFLEKQQLPRGQLGGREKEGGKSLRLKRFEQILIDILAKPKGFI